MYKTTSSQQDFCTGALTILPKLRAAGTLREGIPITTGESGDHLKSHSDVVMVAEECFKCSKSHSDGVLTKKDNIEQNQKAFSLEQ